MSTIEPSSPRWYDGYVHGAFGLATTSREPDYADGYVTGEADGQDVPLLSLIIDGQQWHGRAGMGTGPVLLHNPDTGRIVTVPVEIIRTLHAALGPARPSS